MFSANQLCWYFRISKYHISSYDYWTLGAWSLVGFADGKHGHRNNNSDEKMEVLQWKDIWSGQRGSSWKTGNLVTSSPLVAQPKISPRSPKIVSKWRKTKPFMVNQYFLFSFFGPGQLVSTLENIHLAPNRDAWHSVTLNQTFWQFIID